MKKILIPLALAVFLSACANSNESEENKPKLENVEESQDSNKAIKRDKTIYEYFDTVTSFIAYTDSQEEFEKFANILEDELKNYHMLYNSYDNFDGVNNFLTINQNAGKKPVKVDKKIIDLINYSKEMYDLTGGNINIAMGSLLGLWHDFRELSTNEPEKAAIPEKSDLEQASQHKDIEKIIVDEENSTVFIEDPKIQIDIGAIGKGYATKMIGQRLKEEGLKSGILSVGGDDIVFGENPENSNGNWNIAILNPELEDKEKDYISVVGLKDTSVVTSGDYQRFFLVDGKKYHHIIDPKTMYPSTKWKSVSVIMDDIALADTISTYLFIVDYEEGLDFANKNNAKVLWVDQEGNEYRTDSWEAVEQ